MAQLTGSIHREVSATVAVLSVSQVQVSNVHQLLYKTQSKKATAKDKIKKKLHRSDVLVV